ncbi:uncharacterized protein C9orf117 homolog [Stegastes partitus]|uniref:Uncharacterized protein C9orf117 homolog n=1 Tax=Stegastes partitus TaxID=144197 RepID=A0A9Y4K2B2_9TELE|nr:PREDICTED: uncharacterized protein C9orf117 homolog [Stegastes partitus]
MASKIASEDKERSFYLVRSRYLEDQLERCQPQCDKLETENKDLVSEYDALEKDKRDAIKYLKCPVVVKEKKVSELSEELENQHQTAEWEREDLKLQYSKQMEELQRLRDELDSKRRMQDETADKGAVKLEEQQTDLKQSMQWLSDVQSFLSQEENFRKLRTETALMRERIQSNIECIEEAGAEEESESSVPQTVKDQHSGQLEQLPFLLREAEHRREKLDALQDREEEICSQLCALNKETLAMEIQECSSSKKLNELKALYLQLQREFKDGSVALQDALDKTQDVRQCLHSREFQQQLSELDELKAKLQKDRSQRTELEGVKQEAVVLLGLILTDSEQVFATQWKVQRMLEILESSAPPPWETELSLSDSPQGPKPPELRTSQQTQQSDHMRLHRPV